MDELTKSILIALIPALLVSVFTAYITVKLSIKKFHSREALLRELEVRHASRTRNHDLKLLSLLALAEWVKLFPGVRVAPEADLA